ncbi:molecular chaperone DnaJ [Vibrio vulnificus]|uniref:molecular chaperone DnaJ n=1 Tax=Vibrio TaxID=662 RepID=UPI00237D1D6B|nr:molecular chaperone DnaJ [Vibrio aestuarianus]MDE1319901.1 molecular chaperone DnaJ [Vibrio aestuarianus]MDE1351924.1 molecular chaperone DnaJ [Vibrio aestuarianus]
MADDVTFHECMHCKGTGTCASGKDGGSCAICARRNFILKHSPAHGLVCSVCKGHCKIEPMSSRLKNRTGPILALYIISTAIMMTVVGSKEHFSEVLAFVGTLTGAVTGFYFSGKRNS